MGPPLSTWPYSHPNTQIVDLAQNDTILIENSSNFSRKKCLLTSIVDGFRSTYINLTIILVVLHIIMNLNVVGAGPVILSQNYFQGTVSLARNIRHLPCISRRTGQEGVCMFAIDCLKSNGTHLGTCIDRFYFGSCCQVPEKALLPIDNHIQENTIDDINFIPNKEEKTRINPPKVTTEKVITAAFTDAVPLRTESVVTDSAVESKTTPDNAVEDDKLTTAQTVEVTTKASVSSTTKQQSKATEQPIRLSTFQTVSFDSSSVTENIIQSSEKDNTISSLETTVRPKPSTTQRPARPTRPTRRPTRPAFRPQNGTRPFSSTRPTSVKPFKPGVFNTTRKPPYRPPPLRHTTKKPFPIPPRLNITILPQLTSSRPIFTRPVSATTITYINATSSTTKSPVSSTPAPISSSVSTSTTSIPSTSTVSSTISSSTTTTESEPSSTTLTSTSITVESSSIDLQTLITTQKIDHSSTLNEIVEVSSTTTAPSTQEIKDITQTQEDDEISTLRPSVTAEISETTTDFPPGIVTWTNSIEAVTKSPEAVTKVPEAVTKAPEAVTKIPEAVTKMPEAVTKTPESEKTTEIDDNWSPINPPDGWVLLSTIPPSSQKTDPASTTAIADKATTVADKITTLVDKTTTTIETNYSTEKITTITENESDLSTVEQTIANTKVTEPSPETNEIFTTNIAESTTATAATNTENTHQTSQTIPPTSEQTESIPEPTTTLPESTKPFTVTTEEKETTFTTQSFTTPVATTTVAATVTELPSVATELSSTAPSSELPSTKLPISETPSSAIPEFIVNVTLSPTIPTTTESVLSSTSSSSSPVSEASSTVTVSGNYSGLSTVSVNLTDSEVGDGTTQSSNSTLEATTASTSTALPYNMTNYKEVCGRRLWPEARIVGGAKSAFGKWPWQISLRQWRTHTYLHKCGAALLNENWAITAAHCVEHVPPSELLVRLGEHDLANEEEPYGFAERRVQIVASHPHFDPATFEYDLALLRFYEPVQFQPNILPVCVPDNDENFVGKTAYVTGWGRLFDEGPLPSVLQEVEVPVINNTACEAMYQAAGYNEHIPNIFICAGWKKGGSDSCEGDSGGPMVLQRDRDKRFVLGGVISWGIGCAEPNQPGVYTRISEFRDWINQILQF